MILPLSRSRATLVRSLHRRKGRSEHAAFLAEGERAVRELAAYRDRIRFLVVRYEASARVAEEFPDVECCEVGDDDAGIFATEHDQGIAAVVDLPDPPDVRSLLATAGPVLYLDRLADPGNVGTILRSADWFGVRAVLLGPGSADPYSPKCVRATMGAIFRMSVAERVEPEVILGDGRPVIALDGGAQDELRSAELPPDGIYVVGSEAHGVLPSILADARQVAIEGGGRGDSLNAAVAASVLLYELRARRVMGPR